MSRSGHHSHATSLVLQYLAPNGVYLGQPGTDRKNVARKPVSKARLSVVVGLGEAVREVAAVATAVEVATWEVASWAVLPGET